MKYKIIDFAGSGKDRLIETNDPDLIKAIREFEQDELGIEIIEEAE